MKCPNSYCDFLNEPDAIYCDCGYYFKGKIAPTKTKKCPNSYCDFSNEPEAIYCDCGYHFKDILAPTKRCQNPNCDFLSPLEAICCDCGYEFVKKTPPEEKLMKCPSCGSVQLTANKKGFGLGKAIVGGVLTGGVGLLAGFIGSGKVKITCLKCGHAWKAGKA